MKIFYLGPKGSYSYIISQQMFSDDKLMPLESFIDIVNKVAEGEGLGVLPIENSITSDVHENIDHLFNYQDLRILKEGFLRITLNLISYSGNNQENIRTVYSHPKALEQASKFIETNNLRAEGVQSTAKAQEILLEKVDNTKAAIGPSSLINDKLEIIEKDIGNVKNNKTRFVVISKNYESEEELNEKIKATFIIKIKHVAGSLAVLLKKLADANANLTKIESRPIPGSDWEYLFWIDCEINKQNYDDILEVLSNETIEYRNLGQYNPGEVYQS